MKKVISILAIGIVVFGLIYGGIQALDAIKAKQTVTEVVSSGAVRISLDEWIGWKSMIDANGGLLTAEGSIYDKLGLNVEFVIINDPATSSTDLINGNLAGAGYTINRYAFLQERFDSAGIPVVMPFITNYSNGGDGIIASESIKSVKDLAGKKIAVPRFSEAQTLVEWLLRNSGLTQQEQDDIRAGMVYFDTAEDAGKAFFSGSVDAAATWEPYLTQARTSTDARVLFDTSMSSNLILDGIVFRQAFLDKNPDFVPKLIDGALQAAPLYKTDFKAIKAFPMFEFESNDGIIDMASGANLTNWADNVALLSTDAAQVYEEMAEIWASLGETAHPENAAAAFTDKYAMKLNGRYPTTRSASASFDAKGKQAAQNMGNRDSLMQLSYDIRFEVDSYKISSESYPALNEFARVANMLNGVYIQIEGNTAQVALDDGVEFSRNRALSVAKYLQLFGVDPQRIIVLGNGDKNPVASNDTEEGRAKNRRTDVYFKPAVGY